MATRERVAVCDTPPQAVINPQLLAEIITASDASQDVQLTVVERAPSQHTSTVPVPRPRRKTVPGATADRRLHPNPPSTTDAVDARRPRRVTGDPCGPTPSCQRRSHGPLNARAVGRARVRWMDVYGCTRMLRDAAIPSAIRRYTNVGGAVEQHTSTVDERAGRKPRSAGTRKDHFGLFGGLKVHSADIEVAGPRLMQAC
jgi:hypothetical protein